MALYDRIMTKKKKKKKYATASEVNKPMGAVKAQLKPFSVKRLLFIIITTLAAFSLYEAMIAMPYLRIRGIPVIMPIYFGIVTVLLCAIVILNCGFSTKPVTPDMLRDSEGDDEAHLYEICERLNKRKAIAKGLMLALLPFLFSIFFDIIYLFYGDFFKGAIDAVFG